MRSRFLTGCLLAGLLSASAAPVSGSELRLDHKLYLPEKMLGEPVLVSVSGAPGASVVLLANLTPDPLFGYGPGLAIGFGADTRVTQLPPIPAGGELHTIMQVPTDADLAGKRYFLVALVQDPSFPFGVDQSNLVRIALRDRQVELAGHALPGFPFFQTVKAVNQGSPVELAIDPNRYPQVVGKSADIYVVAAKSRSGWQTDDTLTDVAGGPLPFSFVAGTVQLNTMTLDTGTLSGDPGGPGLGVGYDVVIDFDRNGRFDGADLMDGLSDEAGFYVVHDLVAPGPLPVTTTEYSVGGAYGTQRTYYPSNIAQLGRLPLVVVSHGNGHKYSWYDHIGEHLASYGYIVMSHQNNTVPGSHTAAVTTLSNTEGILENQGVIDGGALDGHIDADRIVWIGHSRGADGVARAYDDMIDGDYVPVNFSIESIQLISSIAPVDFGGTASSNPHGANFHLWVGGADSDVTGCANANAAQSFHLHDRATNIRQSISLHGAGHGDFHNHTGGAFATGPCLVGRADVHKVMKGYLLALVKHHIEGNIPAKDFLWRQYESFHPIGAPLGNPCVVVDLMFREGSETGKYVIDDFQTNSQIDQSSSGGLVAASVSGLAEGRLDDRNNSFNHDGNAYNGFTMGSTGDSTKGISFQFDGSATQVLAFELPEEDRDFTPFEHLSFRACQQTRHQFTVAEIGDTTFDVALVDVHGNKSVIPIGIYGGGVEEPYQRTRCGNTGAGWNNEFETIRIPVHAFRTNGTPLDLTAIRLVGFLFGPGHGSPAGSIGLDDLELTTRD